MPKFVPNWRNAWSLRIFREQFLVSIAALALALIIARLFQDYIETRSGVVFQDPVLQIISAVDLKWITYSLIYSGMLLGLISLSIYPFALLLTMRALVVVILLRIICLSLLPLDPPAHIIPLTDPFIQSTDIHPIYTRDLFFSWHIATLSLFVYTARWRDLKIVFAAGAFVIAILLLIQHADYTIDLVAAPCFAYVSFGIAKWITIREAAAGAASRAERPFGQRGER
jgi:hypothetical protein